MPTSGDIDAAFATIGRERFGALFVSRDPFVNARRVQLVVMAGRHGIRRSIRAVNTQRAG